jgi:tetratricopeptide (TPR) repeat protein
MNRPPNTRMKRLSQGEILTLMKRGYDALMADRLDEAATCCKMVLESAPKTVQAHFLVGLIANENKNTGMAVQAFGSVTTLDPKHGAAWANLARCYYKIGQAKRAEDAIEKAIEAGTKDPKVEDMIGGLLSQLGDQARAKHWYSRAVKRAPNSAQFNSNLGSSLIFLGETDEAEVALERAITANPDAAQAHWLKSSLRRVVDHDHLDVLNDLMKKFKSSPEALSFLAYAAGKEHEDLGEWPEAFECFVRGGAAKKKVIDFDEAREIEMFKAFREVFTRDWVEQEFEGDPSPAPIFIVGQPRTGTTLVERIITAHSMVHSAGELQQFRLSINRHMEHLGGKIVGPFSADHVRASGKIDPTFIGEAYLRSSSNMQGELPRFVDKMPVNYLHIPLIVKALPNAKIIHLVRNPVDSCFSSFKQLFAGAYYHSYDLAEMARHHVRYVQLMQYWRELLPGRFVDVEYEDVVANLEPNARRLIDHLELPWEEACLEFHEQDQAVATASAVQVREKAHTRSVDRWRKYEVQLAPVLDILRESDVLR